MVRFLFNPFTDKLDIAGTGIGPATETLTGNSGGAVSPDVSFNIDTLGDNTTGINVIGNPGTSTLTWYGIASTESQIGTTRYSTNVETAAQTIDTAALTPSNITSMFSTNYLPSSQGGTGLSSPAAHQLIATNGSSAYTALGVAGNGEIPIGSVGTDPVINSITAGTGITVTNGPGTITLSSAASVPILFTEDTGSATPALGNLNVLGSGSIATSGSGNTITTALTGLTDHSVLVGAGTSTITKVAPSATAGIPFVSNGASADPSFTTAVVEGGGTGVVTMTTAYAPVCAGTTATGALQVASTGLSTSGYVLTSNGSAALPSFQASTAPSATCAFSALLSATATNQTGNSASPTVIFDTELFDLGSNYNNATGIFTAPATGNYWCSASVYVTSISVLMTFASIWIDINSTTRAWQTFINPSVIREDNNQGVTLQINGLLNLTAADQVKIVVQLENGAGDTASFASAGASFPWTTFQMWRLT